MSAIAKALKADLMLLTFKQENTFEPSRFSPPYIVSGLYGRERRERIEAPNRATIKAIFEQREKDKRDLEWERRAYQNHLNGIHTYGFCPWCPANVFYD